MTRYTEAIRANANKTEKEQLTSLMEKFNLSLTEARKTITKELGNKVNLNKLMEAYWDLKFASESEPQDVVDYENLEDDW